MTSTSAWVSGPSGAAALVFGVGANADTACRSLDEILQAARGAREELDRAEAALASGSMLLCRNLINNIESKVPVIKGVLNSYATDLGSLNANVQELQQDVETLKAQVAALTANAAGREQRVALGEAAYMLDTAACAFVFRGEKHREGMTIGQLDYNARYGDLSPAQQTRWGTFREFLKRKGWPVGDACITSGVIKDLRAEGAHLIKEDDRAKVTLGDLDSYIQSHAKPAQVSDCKEFVRLVASFGYNGMPLVLGEIVSLVENESKE